MSMTAQERLRPVRLDKIRINPVALRGVDKTEEEFTELVGSVRNMGVINAISVRYKPDSADGKDYELIDGLQRFTASQEAGSGMVETTPEGKRQIKDEDGVGLIPAQILEREDDEALLSQIIGNVHKIETKPAEYAKGLRRMLSYKPTMTESELASLLNKSPAWINQQLKLLKLHEAAKTLVNGGQIPLSNAYNLAKLPPEEQVQWLDRAQTMAAEQFAESVNVRVKAIRESNRRGEDAKEETFQPVRLLRKKPELESELDNPQAAETLINETDTLKNVKRGDLLGAAKAGFALALKWVLSNDPRSVEAQRVAYEARKEKEAQDKVRRDAEKRDKRAKEAREKSEKAQKEAEEAREKLAALPAAAAEPIAATV